MVIDMSQGPPDHAWPADPYWRDKIRIAKQARELGQGRGHIGVNVSTKRQKEIRNGLVNWI